MIIAKSICASPMAIWLFSIKLGSFQPHIICPIEIYINGARNTKDAASRLTNFGVWVSFNSSSGLLLTFLFFILSEAPYPAFSTASIISFDVAVPSTPIEFVNKFTEQEATPSTELTAFSTLAEQAAQLIPVTLY